MMQPYRFPYENYKITGDTRLIDTIIHTDGPITIDVADIVSTLSTDTMNFVTVGVGISISDAMKHSVGSLAAPLERIEKILFQILLPKGCKSAMSELKNAISYLRGMPDDIDMCWGFAYEESLTDSTKVILLASSKH